MTFYQVHQTFTIQSSWDRDDLCGIVVVSSDRLWECTCKLKAPVGMDSTTFINLLKHAFLTDTSGIKINKSGENLLIDCNHSSDGVTFTFASFKLEQAAGTNVLSFYQQAIMDLLKADIVKRNYVTELETKVRSIEQVTAELEKELTTQSQTHMRDSAALTSVFKRIVNSKKRKIRALAEKN